MDALDERAAPAGKMRDSQRSAGGQLLQPSEVKSSTTGSTVSVLRAMHEGPACARQVQAIAAHAIATEKRAGAFMCIGRAAVPRPYTARGGTHATMTRTRRLSRETKGESSMGIMGIIWTIIVGFIVGLIARWIMPGTFAMGFWVTSLLGIGGSIVGGIVSSLIFRSPDGRFHPAGFILSVLGAIVLLWAYNYFMVGGARV
jgi:uncharacterized membrane protein YeaQ/YmgE (transglycosylase-associated protein family)